MTCYMPSVGLSALSTFAFHHIIISGDIVAARSCPLCIQTKASLIQLAIGVGYPIIAASSVCFFTAEKLLTYPIPPLFRAPKEVFALFGKIILKTPRPYLVISALHLIATSFITYEKQKSFFKIDHELSKPRK